VAKPRISVFASSANGNPATVRTIEGPKTLQARTSHEISVDTVHDEYVVPNPFAQALLFFRGGATGDEAPIRIIQGPKTLLSYPTDNVVIDGDHSEVFVAQSFTNSVFVFRSDVGGDVAPIRIIHGPKTGLDTPIHIGVDPVNNLLAVTTKTGLWIFNRTDDGDVAPRWIIAGPNTGLGVDKHTRTVLLSPEGKKIIAGGAFTVNGKSRTFIGVWNYGDHGDIAPWAALNSTPVTKMRNAGHLGLDSTDKELLAAGDGRLVVYHMPELFQ
jgi:hypothetical protein